MTNNSWAILAVVLLVVAFGFFSSTIGLNLLATTTDTATTSSASGLEIYTGNGRDELTILRGCSEDQVVKRNASNLWACADDSTTSVTGAGADVFDIGDDDVNESTDFNELATTGDTNSVITEPAADKVLIDFGQNWPTADAADALSADPTDCAADTKADSIAASGNLICSAVDTGDITDNTILPADLSGNATFADEECITYESTGPTFEGQACDSVNSFETISAPAGTNPVADSATDTLNLIVSSGMGITGSASTDTLEFFVDLVDDADGVSATTSSESGLETLAGELGLIRGCSNGQLLKWVSATESYDCSADATGGSPTFDAIASGTNTTAGMIVSTGASITVDGTGVVESTQLLNGVHNDSGVTLFECTAVYISGFDIPSSLPEVAIADADNAAASPAIGLIAADIADGADGFVVVGGSLFQLDTSVIEVWTTGDELFLNDSGTSGDTDCSNTLTNVRPANTDDNVQRLAVVERVNATNGALKVIGVGRDVDNPNLADDNIWVGSATNVATATALPDCTDTGGNHLNYTAASNSISCGTSGGQFLFETINAPAGTDPVADGTTDTLNLDSPLGTVAVTGNASTDTLSFDVQTDGVGTDQLNDGADVPASGECVQVGTPATTLVYGACGGAGANLFETFDAPIGTDPVADSATDTLIFNSPVGTVAITGSASTDTLSFDVLLAPRLTANGANCVANQFNKGVDAFGAAEACAALLDADIPDTITIGNAGTVDPDALSCDVGDDDQLSDDCLANPNTNANSFETWNAPAGTDPVADSATDTINFDSPLATLSITGNATTDTMSFDIASVDISDHTNLTADRSLTLTGDGVAADAELYTDTKCLWFEDPTAADDFNSIWRNSTGNDVTLTEIWAESDQTVNFDLQVDDGTPADVNGTDISPAAGEAEDTTLSGDTTLAQNEELDLAITSVSGTPTWVSICWTFEWVD